MYSLALERTFAHTAIQCMERLEHAYGRGEDKCSDFTPVSCLTDIRASARKVKALGIYRACLLCEDIIDREGPAPSTNLLNALLGLKTLISQYTDGLIEIDPDFKPLKTPDTHAAQSRGTNHKAKTDITALAKTRAATLKPLLEFAANDRQKQALSFLLDYTTTPVEADATPKSTISFERMMQEVSSTTLREARLRRKMISLSYMADFEILPHDNARLARTVLKNLCMVIVQNADKSHSTQISISGRESGTSTSFSVVWPGRGLDDNTVSTFLSSPVIRDFKARSGQIVLKPESGPGLAEIHSVELSLPTTHVQNTGSAPVEMLETSIGAVSGAQI
ncbi:MAG TPA: hypothetical protein ENJ42_06330 [Hellea balneolensis]|uniref:Uncharacterized protein n=1 Tax=Hellea balneolensis TaxID=287478 RepID=A0A7C5LZW2_9PROT|nr:hypothetical protein [Hellea balneolensis]